MQIYKKVYTRENSLIAIQVWEEHQIHRLKQKVGEHAPLSVFDVHGGVAYVYYDEKIFDIWGEIIANKANSDPNFVKETMDWYGEHLDKLEVIWKNKKLSSAQELVDLFDLVAWSWVGVSVSYCLPDIKSVSKESQDLGMALRQRSVDFLDLTDGVIRSTLRDLYPDLGDLVKYLMIEEVRDGKIPSRDVLEAREKHYIYFDFKLYTDKALEELTGENGIEIEYEKIPEKISEIKGQIAMKGKVTGKVRVLHQKSQIPHLLEGEVLVTAMTTPDYLPAMHKASAFVTDEGGITCHAAIVAREIGKPCIIGTKMATEVLKDGDLVEVDADKGVVRIIK